MPSIEVRCAVIAAAGAALLACTDVAPHPIGVGAGVGGAEGGSGGMSSGGAAGGEGGAGGSGGEVPAPEPSCDPPEGTLPALQLTLLANGFSKRPLLLRAPPGERDRLFVIEQNGLVHLLADGEVSTFLDIRDKVGNALANETGLLGFTFHPDYADNGRFFVHYSDLEGDTVIGEYRVAPNNPDLADPFPVVEPVLTVDQPVGNHNGGSIEFSPIDGMLYIGLGDGGPGQDPDNRGQDVNSLLATILRIDVDAGSPYAIPDGNFTGGLPEIWDYGLRNPYRFSFDVCTGDLYIGDVGQNAIEEIDYEPAGMGRRNYGWSLMEGDACYRPSTDCNPDDDLQLPVLAVPHQSGTCNSIVGGYVYRGHAIPALRGTYLYGDTCRRYIRGFRIENGTVTEPIDLSADLVVENGLWSFSQDNFGELYVLAGDSVYRIDPAR
jgi:glucose/arabinose dehydrogenase